MAKESDLLLTKTQNMGSKIEKFFRNEFGVFRTMSDGQFNQMRKEVAA